MTKQSIFKDLGAGKAHFFDGVPHIRELGITLVDAGHGEVTLGLPYQKRLIGDPDTGVLAGGVITTLIDSAGGAAVFAALGSFQPIATLDLRIDYLKPATPGRDLLAHAHCYRLTRWIAFVRGVAFHDDRSDPIAHCAATFMATRDRPFPKPGKD